MGPAQAMGTFLRTWRSEWAGLTRAQLAIALSAATGKGKTIKPGTIREWETGQPPKSTSELESLLQVMRRHGLTIPEVQQFRTAVFAACLDRHYPGLVDDGEFAYRADVDEVVGACCWAMDIVRLVGGVTELDGALRSPRGHVSASQTRRQQAALVWLRVTLAERHERAVRLALAVPLYAANAECLNLSFSPRGLGPWLTPLYQRLMQLFNGHAVLAYAGPSSHDRAAVELRRVLRVAERARGAGDNPTWFQGLYGSLTQIGFLARPEMEAMFEEAEAQLSWAEDMGVNPPPGPLLCLISAAVQLGLSDKAERYLFELDRAKHLISEGTFQWLMAAAGVAAFRGGFAEAQTYAQGALAYVEPGNERKALNVRVCLENLERAQHAARHGK